MITLTENAARHVQGYIAKRGRGLGLRLGVKTVGCSGMAYKVDFADVLQAGDVRFESHGVALFVDPKSLAFIDGMEVDYGRDGLKEGFKFTNPNVKGECGCGESFSV